MWSVYDEKSRNAGTGTVSYTHLDVYKRQTHYITKLADAYKVSGDSFYMQDGKAVLP